MEEVDIRSFNKKTYKLAQKQFTFFIDFFEEYNIPYFLEGGTLLGIVRDNKLLPWDHDIDFSINEDSLEAMMKLKWKLLFKGYYCSIRKSRVTKAPFRKGDITIIKLKPLLSYILAMFIKKYNSEAVVVDLFVKREDEKHSYWQAMNSIMRTSKKHYQSYETIKYSNRKVKIPYMFNEYLTNKYGDWSVPVKKWECGIDEKTIVYKINVN